MATIEDLKAKLATATAAVEAAQAKGDEAAELRAIDAEDAARDELRAEQARARKLVLKRAERDARKTAAGAYSVTGVDIASMLPDADPDKLPGGGVIVVRSHTAASKKAWDAEVGVANGRPMADIMADLVGENTLRPDLSKPGEGERFRVFLESDLGSGIANQLGAKVLALGGARADEQKRASK